MDPRTVGPVLLGTPVGLASGLDEPICGLLREQTPRAVSERAFEQDQVNVFFVFVAAAVFPVPDENVFKILISILQTHACVLVCM